MSTETCIKTRFTFSEDKGRFYCFCSVISYLRLLENGIFKMSRDNKKKIDWSRGRYREMLVWQRRQMWFEDIIERLARWMNLTPGMIAVDIQ